MNGRAYYNEIEPFAAQWLRNLIAGGHIAPGDVDERSIVDVRPTDLAGYTQCHFFAGIGGWSLALRRAGWPDDRPVWTGSCPCQPFSAAGKGGGFADERHLWPSWFHLIRECSPSVVFGEQVASKDGLGWLDLVQADLEGSGYACGAVDLCAAGIGAPHIRQRQWWVGERMADTHGRNACSKGIQRSGQYGQQSQDGLACGMADALRDGTGNRPGCGVGAQAALDGRDGYLPGERLRAGIEGAFRGLGHAHSTGARRDTRAALGAEGSGESSRRSDGFVGCHGPSPSSSDGSPGPVNGLWRDADWLFCRDGKWRPVEPGTFPLLDGLSANLARLRSIENSWLEEVSRHASAFNTDPDEILRVVREAVCSEPRREEFAIGVREQLHEAPLLLDFLLCVEAAREGPPDRSGFEKASAEVRERIVRGVRSYKEFGGSSRRWRSEEQPAAQSSDPVFSMSLVLARHAAAYREAARRAHAASSRAGLLRGAGNAIVPEVAAEFIRAYLECRPGAQP